MLAEAMPRIEKELAASENAILESNSILEFLTPDLYLTVLDPAVEDFKNSARRFLDRADAVLISSTGEIHAPAADEKPRFWVPPPDYMSGELVDFVRARLAPQVATVS
jgi:hypothetical protein